MAQRNIVMTAATLANAQQLGFERDVSGNVRIRADVAAPDSPLRDVRTILLSETSLSAAQRSGLTDALAVILADMQAQNPPYA